MDLLYLLRCLVGTAYDNTSTFVVS
ncbi:MAG: hypothetical protein EZS28_002555, partial [Streblomastix strix]